MTLPSSGPLSMSAINAEFGRGNDLNSYRGTTWYTDAGGSGTFSSGAISMSEFYGKRATSPANYVNPLGFNGGTYSDYDFSIYPSSASAATSLNVYSDGIWAIIATVEGGLASGNWLTPTTGGVGTGKYVRFTLNSTSGTNQTGWSTSSGWLELNATRSVSVSASVNFSQAATKTRDANYTVQIATDSGGSNIVTSGTLTLTAYAQSEI